MDILSIVITATGAIEIHPGEGFTSEHCDLLVEAHDSVLTALAKRPV